MGVRNWGVKPKDSYYELLY